MKTVEVRRNPGARARATWRHFLVSGLLLLLLAAGCVALRPPVPASPELGEASLLLALGAPASLSQAVPAGPLPEALEDYHSYWQTHRRRVIRKRHEDILEAGNGDWSEGYRALLTSLYPPETFRQAAAILHRGLLRTEGQARARLEIAVKRHRVARLTVLALVAGQRAAEDHAARNEADEARRRLEALRGGSDNAEDAGPETPAADEARTDE